MHEQIATHLSPVESHLATAVVVRRNPAKTAGLVVGGFLGGLLVEGVRSASIKQRGTLADRMGYPEKAYAVVTTHRVVFFADHKIKINTLGGPIVGYGREHLVSVVPTIRKATDSEVRFSFADGSDLKLVLRKRKEVAAWVAAIEHLMTNATVNAPQGYVPFVLPPGV